MLKGSCVRVAQVDDARDVGRYIAAQTAVWEGLIESDSVSGSMPRQREPHLLAIAPLDADGEVSQLTLKRQVLITGILQVCTHTHLFPFTDRPCLLWN